MKIKLNILCIGLLCCSAEAAIDLISATHEQRYALTAEEIISSHERSSACWDEATLLWYGHNPEQVKTAQRYLIHTATTEEISKNQIFLISFFGNAKPPFPADLIPEFTPEQMAAFSPKTMCFFPDTHLAQITPEQTAVFTDKQKEALIRPWTALCDPEL
ncbi:MAG: hypothetical protein WCK49_08445 [Myxococcaceae bacterium]